MLNDLKNELAISIEIENGYSIGYPNQERQFKMDFLVRFLDFDNEQ